MKLWEISKMKWLSLLMILSPPLLATLNPITYRVDTSTSNLAPTFPVGPQLSGFPNSIVMVQIDNQSASEIEVNCTSPTQPSSNSTNSLYVAGNTAWETPTGIPLLLSPLGKQCWMRSLSGTISSGVIRLSAWGY